MLTFRVFWRRDRVLKSGTALPSPGRPVPAGSRRTQWSGGALYRTGPSSSGRSGSRHHRMRAAVRACRLVPLPKSWRGRTSLTAIASNRLPANGSSTSPGASALHCRRSSSWSCRSGGRSAHAFQLSCWIHRMNPSPDLCNRALWVLRWVGVCRAGTPPREDRAISIFGQQDWPQHYENSAHADKARLRAPAGLAHGEGPMIAPAQRPRVTEDRLWSILGASETVAAGQQGGK